MSDHLTINDAASLLLGAGLTQIQGDVYLGLLLIGVATVLKVGVAYLLTKNIVVNGVPNQ